MIVKDTLVSYESSYLASLLIGTVDKSVLINTKHFISVGNADGTASLEFYMNRFNDSEPKLSLKTASYTTVLAAYNTSITSSALTYSVYEDGDVTVDPVSKTFHIEHFVFGMPKDDDTSYVWFLVGGLIKKHLVLGSIDDIYTALSTAVTFTITNADGGAALEGILVSLDGYGTALTNSSGVAVFYNVLDVTYDYTLSYGDSPDVEDEVTVDGDTSVADTFDITVVTFTVTDGTDPLAGAVVALTGYGTATTNASGVATFTDVANGTIAYTVTLATYTTISDSVVVSSDTAEAVTMVLA